VLYLTTDEFLVTILSQRYTFLHVVVMACESSVQASNFGPVLPVGSCRKP